MKRRITLTQLGPLAGMPTQRTSLYAEDVETVTGGGGMSTIVGLYSGRFLTVTEKLDVVNALVDGSAEA